MNGVDESGSEKEGGRKLDDGPSNALKEKLGALASQKCHLCAVS